MSNFFADGFSIKQSLCIQLTKATPNDSSFARIRNRLPLEI
ncbi:hypothetical protein [Rubinisphaera italica]|nr:hypothetical protein [Rubinisphaera italica]